MTILQSLKKLHKKMTGQETTSKTIGGVLDSMQENYNGGSGSDDTYETLTFTIAALTEAEIPEGIQMYSLVEKSDNLSLDNFEIYFNSLDYPLIKQELKSEGQYHYCYNMNIESLEVTTPPAYDLMVMEDDDDLLFLTTEQFAPGDKITILKKVPGSSAGLPAVTANDNGMVLGVVNGAWNKMEIGGPTYETIDEIEIGEMVLDDQSSLYTYSCSEEAPAVTSTDEVRVRLDDGPEYDATVFVGDGGVVSIMYNFDTLEGATGTPVYGVVCGSGVCHIVLDANRSGSTLYILKKVSSGGELPLQGASGNVLTSTGTEWVSAPPVDNEFLIETKLNLPSMTLADAAVPYADVAAAVVAGKVVRVVATNEDYGIPIIGIGYITFVGENTMMALGAVNGSLFFSNIVPSNGGAKTGFSAIYLDVNKLEPLVATATSTDDSNGDTITISGASLSDICQAAAIGRSVWCDYEVMQGVHVRMALSGYSYTDADNCMASFCAENTDMLEIQTRVILCRRTGGTNDHRIYKLTKQLGA